MATLNIIDRSGNHTIVEAKDGQSVMEIIRDSCCDELLALCGGCCSCATCHVIIDDEFQSLMPEMTDDEDDLLDSSDHRQQGSRLSCQLQFSDNMDGLAVSIAPED
jgi:2Fe-2S ferredoxin|tara:strand:- start:21597 stop:21914 length:318 start_codon:yes stop_codon:yes gene_type:complete